MTLIINPGSGPVAGATREHAEANIAAFIADLALPVVVTSTLTPALYRRDDAGHSTYGEVDDGRYLYSLEHAGHFTYVAMPGLPLEQVRYLDGDPWPFPRLYVDGDSWLWKWALSNARRALGQGEAEDGGMSTPTVRPCHTCGGTGVVYPVRAGDATLPRLCAVCRGTGVVKEKEQAQEKEGQRGRW